MSAANALTNLRYTPAKVAALRVNGETVADDSLAELDEITGNDIVSTLARIVTGDSQLIGNPQPATGFCRSQRQHATGEHSYW